MTSPCFSYDFMDDMTPKERYNYLQEKMSNNENSWIFQYADTPLSQKRLGIGFQNQAKVASVSKDNFFGENDAIYENPFYTIGQKSFTQKGENHPKNLILFNRFIKEDTTNRLSISFESNDKNNPYSYIRNGAVHGLLHDNPGIITSISYAHLYTISKGFKGTFSDVFKDKHGQNEYACISFITTNEKFQKKGYGTLAVNELVSFLFKTTSINFVLSDARAEGSRKIFSRLGFTTSVPACSYYCGFGGNMSLSRAKWQELDRLLEDPEEVPEPVVRQELKKEEE
ncbi:MAG TPA: GNAT family N-acetyltransferase [Alphaproteobacteria bacterium]|nr:GNAT family N-acetyltransferase [Alphaproteobacteria bacterium]